MPYFPYIVIPAEHLGPALDAHFREDYQTAHELYRLALLEDPRDATAANNLALCLAVSPGKSNEAAMAIGRAELIAPSHPAIAINAALMAMSR